MKNITDTGIYFNPQKSKELKKDVYEHRWIVVTVYTLSRNEVLESIRGEKVQLDGESLADISPICCFICELTFELAGHRVCPGEPLGYSPDGRPNHHQRWVREAFKQMDEEKRTSGN